MKYKPKRFFLFAIVLLIILYYTYQTISSLNEESSSSADGYESEMNRLREKISELEQQASENEKNYKSLQEVYKRLKQNHRKSDDNNNDKNKNQNQIDEPITHQQQEDQKEAKREEKKTSKFSLSRATFIEKEEKPYKRQCAFFQEQLAKNADYSASELYEKLDFADIDGGVWKQGFEITYDESKWTQQDKLTVIVVPHSHNDPGWLLTFEDYFSSKTKFILDTIVEALSEKASRKFIWAETSYLSLWWQQASSSMRDKLKRLVLETGQLEIVTGGWVMTDEANSYYYAMIEQMIEGHDWLKANIDESLRPSYGWSIDPFGYTPTMAYLLKQMGFDAMLVQRVHYHLKKYLAQTQRFEFKWRQPWTTTYSKETDMFCHVMPFYSYDVPHTCGPDPKICCQFDFKRLSRSVSCPWGIQPQRITDSNVQERAALLLDQYRKKSQLYGDKNHHNVLLVPLGDDFRYTDMGEARDQFVNYEKLMEYMNNRKDWNVEVKFGTLRDYFELVAQNNYKHQIKVESFNGDFFTYADRNDNYWSGYYTSRPFYKRLDRLVEYYLRAAEILYSYSHVLKSLSGAKFNAHESLYGDLLVARRNLALFQHHDGITGTAKTPVVQDYARKLFKSIDNSKKIIENAVSFLMTNDNANNVFSIDDAKIDTTIAIKLSEENEEKEFVLFNPSTNQRNELVSIKVNTPNVRIVDAKSGVELKELQISPIWPNTQTAEDIGSSERIANNMDLNFALDFDPNFVEISFDANLAPLSLTKFKVIRTKSKSPTVTRTTFYAKNVDNAKSAMKRMSEKMAIVDGRVDFKSIGSETDILVKIDSTYSAKFSAKTGYLSHLINGKDGTETKCAMSFVKYGTTMATEKSGAYLFLPDGPAKQLDSSSLVQWIRVEDEAPKRVRVCTNMTHILHCVEFYPSSSNAMELKYPLIGIWNMVDLRQTHNYELALLINSNIENKNTFYTDLNGFQYVKRKFYAKLPVQGNVYPMPSGAFIQDSKLRMSLLSTQPLGVTSLENSQLQVFLDRRLDQDDNRGLGQPTDDNRLTPSRFYVLVESINGDLAVSSSETAEPLGSKNPSLLAQWLSFDLMNPIMKIVPANVRDKIVDSRNLLNDQMSYPCDMRLVNLRTMQTSDNQPKEREIGLIMHRVLYEDCPSAPYVKLPPGLITRCESEKSDDFSFRNFFDFFLAQQKKAELRIEKTFLTLTSKSSAASNQKFIIDNTDSMNSHVQPMQIEAFKINFA